MCFGQSDGLERGGLIMIRFLPWLGLSIVLIVALYNWRKDVKEQARLDALAIKRMKEQLKGED
jgi:hypothetical protein